jgi:signal transduction histidine kinase/putative methionine-R-sulfoxide reductase with GAF domain
VESIKRALDHLLSVPATDPDEARRRKLLNILLFSAVILMLVGVIATSVGLAVPPPADKVLQFYFGVLALLFGTALIFFINRYGLGRLARVLFLLGLVIPGFFDDPGDLMLGRSLLLLAIPIFAASFLLQPYASFVVAGLVVVLVTGVRAQVTHTLSLPDVWALLGISLVALVSWLAARNLEHVLKDLRTANRELDLRVAERTRDLQRRSIQLQAASEVARDATGILDVQELLDETVHRISERFDFYHAGVFLVDGEGRCVTLRAASSESGQRMIEEGYSLGVGEEGIVGHVADSGEHLVVLDVGREAAQFVNPGLPDTRSEMALPLVSRGRIIGVLDVHSTQPSIFTEEDVATLQTMADQLAHAIENAGLYESITRHVEELTALHAIDMAMISTLDLDEVLSIIYEQVSGVMNVSTFYIALYDKRHDELDVKLLVECGERRQPVALSIRGNGGPAARVVRTGEPLWVDDAADEQSGISPGSLVTNGAMRSLAVLPLIVRDQVIGVISAQAPEPEAFDKSDQLLASIAYQAAIAVTNAKLFEEVNRRLDEANLVQEVVLAAASTLDFDVALERAIKSLHRALRVDRLGFLLYDEKDDALVLHPSLVGFAQDAPRLPLKGSVVGQAYRTGRPVLMSDKAQGPSYVCQSPDVCSALAVPVRIGGNVAAVLLAESPQARAFDEDELRVLTTVAGQLGVALENARLYQEMARHTHSLRLLADGSAGMVGSLKIQEIVDHLQNVLVERFRSPCFISLVEPEGDSAAVVAGWMPDEVSLPVGRRVTIPEQGGLRLMMETRRLVYVLDVEQDEWRTLVDEPQREAMRQAGVGAGLVLPMLSQDNLVGIVSLGFQEPLPEPAEEPLDWAQTLVNQAAAAVANARLYQQLETQAAELATAYSELQEVDRLRAQLVQNVGHELRTPLGLIKGYVELLIGGDLGKVSASQRAALQVMRERTATLVRLIHNLTVLQAVPREALAVAPLSMAEIVRQVLIEFQGVAEEASIVFQEEIPDGLPTLLGDRERLELALGHLVDNSIKFSPDGGTVTIKAWADERMIHVSVSDEGIGISLDSIGRIFERFYQVDGSTKRRYGGMGVGLALVWEIVELHDGTVQAESEPGKGSTFTISLPRADIPQSA